MTPLPPKQGLKLHSLTTDEHLPSGYDTTSTKTRIETSRTPSLGFSGVLL